MQRPVSYKSLYRFTPFEMRTDPNANVENVQYWVAESLSELLGMSPKDIGYLSTNLTMNVESGDVVLDIMFRADDCITYKRNEATGRALPKINPLLNNLSGRFFFGKVEENADLGTQTVRHYKKTKKGDFKENRSERENDIDVLIVHANIFLFMCYLLNVSPADKLLEIRCSALRQKELSQPEEYKYDIPCRVNIVTGDGSRFFDPDAVEDNIYSILKIQERMTMLGKEERKAMIEAGENAYHAKAKKHGDKKKKQKNGDGSVAGKSSRGVGKL